MRYQQPLANKMLDSHSDKKDPNHKKESRPSRGSSHQSPCYFSITKVQVQDGVLLFHTPTQTRKITASPRSNVIWALCLDFFVRELKFRL